MKTALIALLFILGATFVPSSAYAGSVQVCNDEEPPVCETVQVEPKSNSRRGAMYFFKALGLDVTKEQAQAFWKNRDIREQVMSVWRSQVFGK